MKNLSIKNSTIQFLAFVSEQGGDIVGIVFQNGDLWASEKVMATLYGIDRSGITLGCSPQDQLYQSDFDRFLQLEGKTNKLSKNE
jgi:hypothetical protein